MEADADAAVALLGLCATPPSVPKISINDADRDTPGGRIRFGPGALEVAHTREYVSVQLYAARGRESAIARMIRKRVMTHILPPTDYYSRALRHVSSTHDPAPSKSA